MTQNLTIGFIGYGNMAQAIAQGFVDAGVVTGGQMVACAAHYDKLEKTTAELGVRPLHNALEVVTAADVVIIAIKPYQIAAVVKPLADELAKPGKIVVSIAAGWNLKKYQDLFATEDGESVDSSDIHIQCTIPNTPMAVGKGVLVTESVNTLTDDETETFEQLFGPISLIERVDTAHMNIAWWWPAARPPSLTCTSRPWATPACSTVCSEPPPTGSPPRWSKVSARSTWPPKPIPGP